MGITGLLPFLKNACRPACVDEFSGKVAAVDVYVWLHRGAFGCAEMLVRGENTDGYVKYVMKLVDMLLYYNIKPILVFDGRNLPSKAQTEATRRENREKHRKMAKDYLNEGKYREAVECFQRAIDVTPKMARDVIQACRDRNIDCIVAPYEADAQLAFLISNGIADIIISEDSDLALFGCQKILFKMDKQGNGVLYDKELLPQCLGNRGLNFDFQKFRYMCIMAGCDYLASLPGIGLGKSYKFWGKVTQPSLELALPKIPGYLNMNKIKVDEEYVQGFIKANLTFLYQIVYDPIERKMRPLHPYENDVELKDLSFAGELITDEKQAFDLAIGNLNISRKKLEKVTDFDPENPPVIKNPCYGKRAIHPSIWKNENSQKLQAKTSLEANENIHSSFSEKRKSKEDTYNCIDVGHNTSKKSLLEQNSIVNLKPNNEQVWYISKYFKQKSLHNENDKQNVLNIGGVSSPVPECDKNEGDKNEGDDSEDIAQLYNDKPKCIVNTPPCSPLDTATESYGESYFKLNDEDQENMCNDASISQNNEEKKSRKFQFSPKHTTTLGTEIKSNENEVNNWFDQLETDSALESGNVIYNTLSIESTSNKDNSSKSRINDKASDINKTNVGSTLSQFQFTNSPASRQAFKPVLFNKSNNSTSNPTTLRDNKDSNQGPVDSEIEKTRKRNPFAKVLVTSPKKETYVAHPEKIENTSSSCASSETDNYNKGKDPTEIHSEILIDGNIRCNAVSLDKIETENSVTVTADTPTSRKLSSLFSPLSTTTPTAKKPRISFSSPSPGNPSETSCYFSQTKSNSGLKEQQNTTSSGKARVSGLLKKKNSQPNLLQMWSKMN